MAPINLQLAYAGLSAHDDLAITAAVGFRKL